MKREELDRILSRETEIVPSSEFTRSVMSAVRAEAAVPPPIPFPWLRAMPGLVVWGIAIVWAVTEGIHFRTEESASWLSSRMWEMTDQVRPLVTRAEMLGIGWVLLAFVMTAACLKLTVILVHRRA